MALRGRRSKPTVLKVLEGNPGKRQLNKNEPKPAPISPKIPKWLDADAKKMWRHLAPQLASLGLLTIVDGYSLAAACQSYSTWVRCEEYLQENGMTYTTIADSGCEYVYQRPEVAISNKALQAFKSFCTEFGLTPASRCRIDTKPPGVEKDPMEALLRKRGG